MKKIKYYLKRLFSMNYKAFFETINIASKESGKFKIFIFFDLVYASIFYGAGHLDYRNFKMYNLKKNDRNKILTVGRNASLIRKLNNKESQYIFENKPKFYEVFKDYINREYLTINKDNFNEFKRFLKGKTCIIVKPIDGSCGKGVEKIDLKGVNEKELYNRLINEKKLLIEEVVKQCSEMSNLHPSSINTIRVFTIVNEYDVFNIVGTYIRIGNNGNVVDNFNGGGIACPVDINSGKITHKAINKKGEYFFVHPVSKVKLIGYQIPKWKETLRFIHEVSKVVKDVRYVGWDVCIGEDGPFLIEANSFPGQDLYQLPDEDIGTYNVMLDAINNDYEKLP